MCFSIKTERSLYYYDAKLKKRLQISPTLHGFLSFLLGKYFKGKEDGQKRLLVFRGISRGIHGPTLQIFGLVAPLSAGWGALRADTIVSISGRVW